MPPEKQDKYLKMIHHNVDYLNRLIDDLFLFSKLDMQKLEFSFARVSIRAYLSDLMEEYRLELVDRQIRFRFDDELAGEPVVSLDTKRFFQAINNIVRNAVGHGPRAMGCPCGWGCPGGTAGSPSISRITGRVSRKINFPIFSIVFTGSTTERAKDYQGTGLGLAITKELIQAHGGEVSSQQPQRPGNLLYHCAA